MRSGRPVSSNFSTASLERATRLPGPISLYILHALVTRHKFPKRYLPMDAHRDPMLIDRDRPFACMS
jgi:hypothetical protein